MAREIIVAPDGGIEFGTLIDDRAIRFAAIRIPAAIEGADLILTWREADFVQFADMVGAKAEGIVEEKRLSGL